MGILLTKEETTAIIDRWLNGAIDVTHVSEVIAEAQLKKMAEFIKEHGTSLGMVSSAHSGIALSEEDWQALLEEIDMV